jgi:hypothetical protein
MTAFGTFRSFSMTILLNFYKISRRQNENLIGIFEIYFFSPSKSKNDSKVGGAFILFS